MPTTPIKDKHLKQSKFKIAAFKALRGIMRPLPIILSILLFLSVVSTLPLDRINVLIKQSGPFAILVSAIIGSVSAGNAMTSYILGGDLAKQGISLGVVTAFIIAWVSVGIVQLPAESALLGKKFALWRNAISFIFAIAIAIIFTVLFG